MRPCTPAVPLALLLLVTASAARAQPSPCQTALRRLELARGQGSPPELCISPGLSTTLLFDRELASGAVELEGHERFRRVESTGSLLVLVPSERLAPGERLHLRVRFTEGGPGAGAAFVLVVHRDQAERQIEVSSPRASSPCQAELRRQEEELQRCLAQRSVPSLEEQASLAASVMLDVIDPNLLTSRPVPPSLTGPPGGALAVVQAKVYRARQRFAVELELLNHGHPTPWMAAGATFQGRSGKRLQHFRVVQQAPLAPKRMAKVWVEAPIPAGEALGPMTLEVWDEERTHTLTLKDVRLP